MIELTSFGAARTVTGSKHLLTTSRAAVLLDCGLFQGRRREAFQRNRDVPFDTARLDAVVLSHAHIDHSGALPQLARAGYRGPIYATAATRDLAAPMLLDTAMIQRADARHIAHLIERGAVGVEPVEPLYDEDDVATTMSLMIGLPYHRRQLVAPGVTATFLDAGHVLGSAIVVLDVEDEGRALRLAFTGDLGRRHLPILRDPEVPDGVECLLTETTYGDRLHGDVARIGDELAEVVRRTHARGGKIVIPSFALERAQEVIYELKLLRREGRIPALPVYVDSPLTVKLTDVFRLHPECYDRAARELLAADDSPFHFEGLRYVSSVEESMAIQRDDGPAIVIASSGMCEGGRVLHHLRTTIGDSRNTVVIVGFQAQYTLGRRLVERRREVRIFGLPHARRAEVVTLDGFSAHADQAGLVAFAEEVRRRGPLRRVLLVHGEPPAQDAFAQRLTSLGFPTIDAPTTGQRLRL
ncbi:MAG TPA: MBL fold metallo-hydrolase [Polyangia bacterium]|nr:MBL fold metallo-hydrolase [Polyangia bacterium]